MIDEAIKNLKKSLPYAMLFNPKMFKITVKDKRKMPKFASFFYLRADTTNIGDLSVFNCLYEQQREPEHQKKVFSIAYETNYAAQVTVAVPVVVQGSEVKLLPVKRNIPKIFKEFPLIGSETKLNFVFTSKRFYPNEKRSDLLLTSIQGRFAPKKQENWNALEVVFSVALELHRKIILHLREGQQNLLIFSEQSHLSEYPQFTERQMAGVYNSLKSTIANSPIWLLRDSKKHPLTHLRCIMALNVGKNGQKCSAIFNDLFSFYFQNCTLPNDKFIDFYDLLLQHKQTWQNVIQYKSIDHCFQKMSSLPFSRLKSLCFNDQAKAFEWLSKLYQAIKNFFPQLLDIKTQNGYQFVLTNKQELKSLAFEFVDQRNQGKVITKIKPKPKQAILMIKSLSSVYIEIANRLGLDLNRRFIHDDFTPYFKSVSKYTEDNVHAQFLRRFYISPLCPLSPQYPLYAQEIKELHLKYQFMLTFKITGPIMDIAVQLKQFGRLTEFLLASEEEPTMQPQLKQKHLKKFSNTLMQLIQSWMIQSGTLEIFMKKYMMSRLRQDQAIVWISKLLEEDRENSIKQRLSWEGRFSPANKLLHINGNYPTSADIKFYGEMRFIYYTLTPVPPANKHSTIMSTFGRTQPERKVPNERLQNRLVHPNIREKRPKTQEVNFQELFSFTTQLYDKLETSQKLTFLKYLNQLQKESKDTNSRIEKLKTFSKLMARRHSQYLQLIDHHLQASEKDVVYELLIRKEQIKFIGELINGKLNFEEIIHIVNQHLALKEQQRQENLQKKRKTKISQERSEEKSEEKSDEKSGN